MNAIARSPMLEASFATLTSSLQRLDELPARLTRSQIAELSVVSVDVAQATSVIQLTPGLDAARAAAATASDAVNQLARGAADASKDPANLVAQARSQLSKTIAAAESTIVASQFADHGVDAAGAVRSALEASSSSSEHGAALAMRRAHDIVGEAVPSMLAALERGADPQGAYVELSRLEQVATGIREALGDTAAPWTTGALDAAVEAARTGHAHLRELRTSSGAALAVEALHGGGRRLDVERLIEQRAKVTRTAITTLLDRLELDAARLQGIADARASFDALVGA